MGIASTKKILRQVLGALSEEAALRTTVGAADADRIIALNAAGLVDPSMLNQVTVSAGAADVGKALVLDASGKVDLSVLPLGIAADTRSITTSEILAAGDFVNIWNSTGAKVRKADATVAGKHAMGFVVAAFGSGVPATVYFEGTNSNVVGQTPGDVFLHTTAGLATTTAPTGVGNVIQPIGFATSPTEVNFQSGRPITLA